VARAAIPGRLTWQVGEVVAIRAETASASTLVLDLPDWPGHRAGQHVDVRLTAQDGYTAQRSYSIASAPGQDERIELTVEEADDGEVSPYLVRELKPGYPIELRGPIGGWFVWPTGDTAPVQLIAGGSGIVPLMAMIRARDAVPGAPPFRLLYSARRPSVLLYGDELARRAREHRVTVTVAYTRQAPPADARPPDRVDAALLSQACWPVAAGPAIFVCGPTNFVEAMADLLVAAGHDPLRIRTERFGPSAP
jgi:ferredoxin-NADP reductase